MKLVTSGTGDWADPAPNRHVPDQRSLDLEFGPLTEAHAPLHRGLRFSTLHFSPTTRRPCPNQVVPPAPAGSGVEEGPALAQLPVGGYDAKDPLSEGGVPDPRGWQRRGRGRGRDDIGEFDLVDVGAVDIMELRGRGWGKARPALDSDPSRPSPHPARSGGGRGTQGGRTQTSK